MPPLCIIMAMSQPPNPLAPSTIFQPEINGITHNHVLHREKQITKLIDKSSRNDIEIEVNCNDENVTISCKPGFYDLIARPCLLNITPGDHVRYKGITFELVSITPHSDILGIVQSTVLKLKGVVLSLRQKIRC